MGLRFEENRLGIWELNWNLGNILAGNWDQFTKKLCFITHKLILTRLMASLRGKTECTSHGCYVREMASEDVASFSSLHKAEELWVRE